MKSIRKLYDWVLHFADTPHGAIALFLLAFAESSFFPIPPDALLIALVLGAQKKAFRFATICTAGSILGALLGYAIGHFLWWTPSNEFTSIAMFSLIIFPDLQKQFFIMFKECTSNMIFGLYLQRALHQFHIRLLQFLPVHLI